MKLSDAKPYIIAEIGSNWTNFDQAKDSISMAKACGADAVKFQLFSYEDLYGWHGDIAAGIFGLDPELKVYNSISPSCLPISWLPKLKEKADACGIDFMCTAFSPQLYDAVDPFVKVHKIASSDSTYPQLINKVYSFGKPVILSLGATTAGDIQWILPLLDKNRTILMYCVSAYPSRQHNLFMIDSLKKMTGLPVGYSDHSIDIYSPLSAWFHFKTPVIEKHVNFFDVKGPDAGHSLDKANFKLMCDYLLGEWSISEYRSMDEEKAMFLQHNRRLIATRDISKDDMLRFGENYGAFRSILEDVKGFSPLAWELFEGQQARKDFKAGDGICLG